MERGSSSNTYWTIGAGFLAICSLCVAFFPPLRESLTWNHNVHFAHTCVVSEVWSISDSCFWQCSQKGYLSLKQPPVYGKEMFPSVPAAGSQQHSSVRVCWRPCLALCQALLSWVHAGKEAGAGNNATRSAKSCLLTGKLEPGPSSSRACSMLHRTGSASGALQCCHSPAMAMFCMALASFLAVFIPAAAAASDPSSKGTKQICSLKLQEYWWDRAVQGTSSGFASPSLLALPGLGTGQAWWSAGALQ